MAGRLVGRGGGQTRAVLPGARRLASALSARARGPGAEPGQGLGKLGGSRSRATRCRARGLGAPSGLLAPRPSPCLRGPCGAGPICRAAPRPCRAAARRVLAGAPRVSGGFGGACARRALGAAAPAGRRAASLGRPPGPEHEPARAARWVGLGAGGRRRQARQDQTRQDPARSAAPQHSGHPDEWRARPAARERVRRAYVRELAGPAPARGACCAFPQRACRLNASTVACGQPPARAARARRRSAPTGKAARARLERRLAG